MPPAGSKKKRGGHQGRPFLLFHIFNPNAALIRPGFPIVPEVALLLLPVLRLVYAIVQIVHAVHVAPVFTRKTASLEKSLLQSGPQSLPVHVLIVIFTTRFPSVSFILIYPPLVAGQLVGELGIDVLSAANVLSFPEKVDAY